MVGDHYPYISLLDGYNWGYTRYTLFSDKHVFGDINYPSIDGGKPSKRLVQEIAGPSPWNAGCHVLPRSQNQKERAVAEKQGPREKSKAQPRDENVAVA